jgi:hypothetical protein
MQLLLRKLKLLLRKHVLTEHSKFSELQKLLLQRQLRMQPLLQRLPPMLQRLWRQPLLHALQQRLQVNQSR